MGSQCTELKDLRSSPHVDNHAICYLLMIVSSEEYHARVHIKSKLHYFPLMKDRLWLDRCVLFRETCFGRWLDLTYVQNEESLIHYMLQKQKFSDNDHYDLPLIYNVNEHTLHFGHREFCLIGRCKFGWISFRNFRDADITFHDRVFPEKLGEYVKNIDLISLIEDEVRFIGLSKSDSIRVCLLLSLEVIFMGHDFGSADKKPNYELYTNRVEAQSEWFTRSSDYFKMYALRAPPAEYGGLFGDYLKKVSLVRTLRAKDREPFIQSYPKVVFLKDRVKALEGLCDSLMILPKDIKSLKERVYKLETIINDFNPPLYELPFHKEVPWSETLISFSSKNEEKVFKPGILTSKGVHSSLLPELSHRGPKTFKVTKILESPMEILLYSCGEDIRILDVLCLHFYPL
uniref:Phospholipase-like, aminotransferase-like mobile domain protein n=1 Tax=Tanacetum cinerariifolium TaxID=118510 RepID=A0A699H2X3_TANCI|nr:phospholipase-like, aminotransferase-like mobile domain protein [Tanacetum cinerariifolium]